MARNFQAAFGKMSLLGHDKNSLLDCSELIVSLCLWCDRHVVMPAGKTHNDIEQAVCLTRMIHPSVANTPVPVRHAALPDDAVDPGWPTDQDPASVSTVTGIPVPRLTVCTVSCRISHSGSKPALGRHPSVPNVIC